VAGDPTFRLQTIELDLPGLAARFGRRLREAGLPVGVERELRFARALALVRPIARRRLYWTARAVFVSEPTQGKAFDAVFHDVFGSRLVAEPDVAEDLALIPRPESGPPPDSGRRPESAEARLDGAGLFSPPLAGPGESELQDVPVPVVASDEERLREKRFDALEPSELAELYRLMARLELATPERRTRRAERYRHGARVDMRRTLRRSMRTGGDPVRLARRRRRVVRRPIVLLCDISGSMEPYARTYLQFLTCAAGGARAEAFVFATRLTRLTRALSSRNPERAIQQAAAAAPDWSSGTRIGDALKSFNDRHGRRGMARGAVVVILSDGWERGDPSLVAREMERLGRLAYRVVWVNPRAAATGFSPRAGGMAAALPHCDALVSGHSLAALGAVVEAIGAERWRDAEQESGWRAPELPDPSEPGEEPWASATPVAGSSVAMPSGYGPSRGRTTPGWRSSS
jgi:uncharacterized protein with von Willebrand factor type A (vWA) domain